MFVNTAFFRSEMPISQYKDKFCQKKDTFFWMWAKTFIYLYFCPRSDIGRSDVSLVSLIAKCTESWENTFIFQDHFSFRWISPGQNESVKNREISSYRLDGIPPKITKTTPKFMEAASRGFWHSIMLCELPYLHSRFSFELFLWWSRGFKSPCLNACRTASQVSSPKNDSMRERAERSPTQSIEKIDFGCGILCQSK